MGRNFAITIGINKYKHLTPLNYAKRDAEAMRDYFQRELQFDKVYHFTDDSPPIRQYDNNDKPIDVDSSPTYSSLRRFLRVRFDDEFLRDGDSFWFFFAGHGTPEAGQDYLMLADSDPDDVTNSAIPLSYVTQRLRGCGADNVVMLIDACRSGSKRRSGLGVGVEKQQGVITLFSCSPKQSSYESDQYRHGIFTYALLESLRFETEGKNCATVERLYERLRYRVPELSQECRQPEQTPYGSIEPLTKYHLILLPDKATDRDVVVLKNEAYQAETRGKFALARQLWIVEPRMPPA
jgi:uncharacterized caspase-like protein